ncbi:hypothetical protein C8J57DRAFT_1474380 [Mycena rebaudengoi]|nr:hypothetical protein C8J57DRAFT_1474380 [Mycena rebaudengoi]
MQITSPSPDREERARGWTSTTVLSFSWFFLVSELAVGVTGLMARRSTYISGTTNNTDLIYNNDHSASVYDEDHTSIWSIGGPGCGGEWNDSWCHITIRSSPPGKVSVSSSSVQSTNAQDDFKGRRKDAATKQQPGQFRSAIPRTRVCNYKRQERKPAIHATPDFEKTLGSSTPRSSVI